MAARALLFACALALFLQNIYGQCIGAELTTPLAPLVGEPWAGSWAAGPWVAGSWAGGPWGISPWAAGPWGTGPWGAGTRAAGPWGPYGAAGFYGVEPLTPASASASYGGALPVTSASAIPPTGVSVASENAYAGELAITGALPFLGTVTLEGALPTLGAGAITYGCGNGAVVMVTEDMGVARVTRPLGIDPLGCGVDAFEFTPLGAPYGRYGCGACV